ncbi:tetratricopeptide repeat protein [Peptococcaceae bacterium 1198_IL3148]
MFFFDRKRLKRHARVIVVILVIVLSVGLIMSSIQWASAPLPAATSSNDQQVSQEEMQKALKEQITKLEKEVTEKPKDITLMSQLAYIYQLSGETEQGLKFFQGQIDTLSGLNKENPKDADTLLALAICYDIVGNVDKATEHFNKVIEINPDNYDVRLMLTNVHFHNAKFDLAEEQVKYVVDKQPEDARAINMYAYVLAAKEDYQGAVAQIEKYIEMVGEEGQGVEQAKNDLAEWKKQIKK